MKPPYADYVSHIVRHYYGIDTQLFFSTTKYEQGNKLCKQILSEYSANDQVTIHKLMEVFGGVVERVDAVSKELDIPWQETMSLLSVFERKIARGMDIL